MTKKKYQIKIKKRPQVNRRENKTCSCGILRPKFPITYQNSCLHTRGNSNISCSYRGYQIAPSFSVLLPFYLSYILVSYF
ncbi:hypothetical protein RIF29_20610 [Crotalaria pallida]|uniref:Uncharacterized protein n=1 Tax=Crotalaria pallida TaxID=3830 RepID=A0AAN9F1J5_CROPI